MSTVNLPAAGTSTRRHGRAWWLRAILAAGLGWLGQRALDNWSLHRELTLAREFAGLDDTASAAAYGRYLLHRPDDFAVLMEAAEAKKTSDPEAALALLRQISATAPMYPDAVRQVAAITLDLGRDYDAIEPLNWLKEKFPDDAGVELALAELRFRRREFPGALEHARRARTLVPTLTAAWLVEAESLDELKRPDDMVAPLEAVLKVDSEIPQARLNLAYALQLVGREEEALAHAQWFLERFPKSAAAHRTLALVQRARGEPEAALAAVRKSLALRPGQLDAGVLEVELLLFLRRGEDAREKSLELWNSFGAETRVLSLLSRAALMAGLPKEAAQWQQKLDRLTTESPGTQP